MLTQATKNHIPVEQTNENAFDTKQESEEFPQLKLPFTQVPSNQVLDLLRRAIRIQDTIDEENNRKVGRVAERELRSDSHMEEHTISAESVWEHATELGVSREAFVAALSHQSPLNRFEQNRKQKTKELLLADWASALNVKVEERLRTLVPIFQARITKAIDDITSNPIQYPNREKEIGQIKYSRDEQAFVFKSRFNPDLPLASLWYLTPVVGWLSFAEQIVRRGTYAFPPLFRENLAKPTSPALQEICQYAENLGAKLTFQYAKEQNLIGVDLPLLFHPLRTGAHVRISI